MSIATRPSGPDLLPGSWDGSEPRIDFRPPTVLLPDGGTLAPAPASAPERVLARDALHLIKLARVADRATSPWLDVAASPDVDVIRGQLQPIRTRRSLAASYRREAFHSVGPWDAPTVRLAYALRWLELGPDRA